MFTVNVFYIQKFVLSVKKSVANKKDSAFRKVRPETDLWVKQTLKAVLSDRRSVFLRINFAKSLAELRR